MAYIPHTSPLSKSVTQSEFTYSVAYEYVEFGIVGKGVADRDDNQAPQFILESAQSYHGD